MCEVWASTQISNRVTYQPEMGIPSKLGSIPCGYRKRETHERVFYLTLAHGNSKIEISQKETREDSKKTVMKMERSIVSTKKVRSTQLSKVTLTHPSCSSLTAVSRLLLYLVLCWSFRVNLCSLRHRSWEYFKINCTVSQSLVNSVWIRWRLVSWESPSLMKIDLKMEIIIITRLIIQLVNTYGFFFLWSTIHPRHICPANGPSVTVRRLFEFVHCPINLCGVSNECNLKEISCVHREYGVSTYSR